MTIFRKFIPAVLVLSIGWLAGCSRAGVVDSLETAGPITAVLIGGGQQAPAGSELPDPVVVQVLDGLGRPVANQIVNFVVVAGGGSVYAGAGVTNEEGFARDWWTLGEEPGVNRLEARAVDSTTGQPIVFGTFEATGL